MDHKTRSEKMIRNISMGLISKIVVLVIGFIDRKFFITILGEELLGINGLFSNILLMLSLAEMGLTNVMVFSYYKPLAENDHERLNTLTSFYKKIYNAIAIIVTGIGIAIIPLLKYIVNLEQPIEHLIGIYLIFLANTVMSYLFVYKSTILTADQNGYVITRTQIRFDVLRQVVQIACLIIFRSILVYLGIKVLFVIFNNLYLMRYVDKHYSYLDLKNAKPITESDKKNIVSTIKSGFIYKLSGILLNGTDNILISAIVGTVWVGMLANYDTVIVSITGFVVIIFTSLTASLGNVNITETAEKKYQIFNIVLFAGFWIGLIVIPCCYNMMDDLVRIWLGEKYVLDKSILIIKLALMYLSCTLNPIFSFREATGLFRKSKYIIFAGSVINIILSIVFGIKWGVFGILLASIVSMAVTYVWYEPIILYRDTFEHSPVEYYVKHIVNVICLFIIVFISSSIMSRIYVDGWLMLFVKAGVCFVIVTALSCVVMCRSKEFQYIKQWVMKLLKN